MCRAEGGEEPTVSGPGSAPLGVVVLVVVCVGFLRRPVCLVTPGRGLAWRPVVVLCWEEVGVWVSGHRAEEYAPPVGRGGQGLLQSACAW